MKTVCFFLGLGFVLSGVAGAETTAAVSDVTFYKDVLPVLQDNCQVCHRPNGANLGGMVAPMAFTNYEDTRPWAKAIAKAVGTRQMPPWHASPEQHGQFANERALEQGEVDTILAWVNGGVKAGNPADAPAAKDWPSGNGWTIGEPDLVIPMPERYFVGDDVLDEYQYFSHTLTDEQLPEDRWLKAVEFRAGSPAVHHIILDPFGGIAPGSDAVVYPDGMGRLLKKGTKLTWQMHYHKEPGPGTGMWDQSEVANKFYPKDEPVEYPVLSSFLGNMTFKIPPHDPNYSVTARHIFGADSRIIGLSPHMHLRGKAARYEVAYPDGRTELLLEVPKYDFNWQTTYWYEEPKFMPKGATVTFTSTWDNSAENPDNPDPTIEVVWGEPTTAEMSFGFMDFINARPVTNETD